MKEKLFAIVLSICLFLTVQPTVFAVELPRESSAGAYSVSASYSGTIVGERADVGRWEIAEIPIMITENPGIIALSLSIRYDSDLVDLIGVTDNQLFSGADFISGNDLSQSPFILNWENALTKRNHTETGLLATLQFMPHSNVSGMFDIQIEVNQTSTFDVDLQDVSFRTVAGVIYIDEGNSAPGPSATSAPGTAVTTQTTTRYEDNRSTTGTTATETESSEQMTTTRTTANAPAMTTEDSREQESTQTTTRYDDIHSITTTTATETESSEQMTTTAAQEIIADTVTAAAGETVDVPIRIQDNPGIIALKLNIEYDSEKLELLGVSDGQLFEGAEFLSGNDLSLIPYTLCWDDALTTANHTANGILATLHFRVKADADGTADVKVSVNQRSTFDVNLKDVAFRTVNGRIEIAAKSGEPLPGDLNGDGSVSAADAVLLARFLAEDDTLSAELLENILNANPDIDGDGLLTMLDIAVILNNAAE